MRATRWVSIVVIVMAALGSGRARAQSPGGPTVPGDDVEAKMKSAQVHFDAGDLPAALADLRDAYKMSAKPEILYAMAQIEVQLGDCAVAVDHYGKFLDSKPGPKATEAATKAKADCEAKLAITRQGSGTGTGTPTGTGNVPTGTGTTGDNTTGTGDHTATPTGTNGAGEPHPIDVNPPPIGVKDPAAHPWYKDGLGDALIGVGVVGLAAGGGLYAAARSDLNKSETAANLQGHLDLVDSAHSKRTYAVIAAGVGGALVVGGIVRYVTHHGSSGERAVAVGVGPSGDGGWSIAALGRF